MYDEGAEGTPQSLSSKRGHTLVPLARVALLGWGELQLLNWPQRCGAAVSARPACPLSAHSTTPEIIEEGDDGGGRPSRLRGARYGGERLRGDRAACHRRPGVSSH
jgi:hypothetical protein